MKNIIFILSLPRSGSTLLQRMLLGTGQCASVGEFSLLLRFLGANEDVFRLANYRESNLRISFEDICESRPGFADEYREAVSRFATEIYSNLAGDAPFFVDKTPRYSLICEDLKRTFPNAKFLVLLRHPLDVAASVIETFSKGKWWFGDFLTDLDMGMVRLANFAQHHKDIKIIKYEELVQTPVEHLNEICDFIGIERQGQSDEIVLGNNAFGRLGDPTGIKKYANVSTESLKKYDRVFNNFYRRRWVRDFFSEELRRSVREMGYEFPRELGKQGFFEDLLSGMDDIRYYRVKSKKRTRKAVRIAKRENLNL